MNFTNNAEWIILTSKPGKINIWLLRGQVVVTLREGVLTVGCGMRKCFGALEIGSNLIVVIIYKSSVGYIVKIPLKIYCLLYVNNKQVYTYILHFNCLRLYNSMFTTYSLFWLQVP